MDYSADLRDAADVGGRQRADRQLARRARRRSSTSPLHGTGAGTYRITWDRDRPAPPVKVNDGHSLYLETLSELGVVGLVLLLVALGTIARRRRCCGSAGRSATPTARSSRRARCSRCTPAIDWDWEMPALFVWLFGAGGVVLAARAGRGSASSAARRGSSPRWPCSCSRSRRRCSRYSQRAAGPRRATRSRGATAGRRSTPR